MVKRETHEISNLYSKSTSFCLARNLEICPRCKQDKEWCTLLQRSQHQFGLMDTSLWKVATSVVFSHGRYTLVWTEVCSTLFAEHAGSRSGSLWPSTC